MINIRKIVYAYRHNDGKKWLRQRKTTLSLTLNEKKINALSSNNKWTPINIQPCFVRNLRFIWYYCCCCSFPFLIRHLLCPTMCRTCALCSNHTPVHILLATQYQVKKCARIFWRGKIKSCIPRNAFAQNLIIPVRAAHLQTMGIMLESSNNTATIKQIHSFFCCSSFNTKLYSFSFSLSL